MLTHYMDARETLQQPGVNIGRSERDTVMLMPKVWTHSYRELERTLGQIRAHPAKTWKTVPHQKLYWNVSHWYLRVEKFWQTPPPRVVKRGRVQSTVQDPRRLVVRRHANVDPQLALAGLGLVSHTFRGEPSLPDEIRSAPIISAAA